MNKKMLALYGLKWNPFAPDVPVEALHVTRRIESFCWRVQQLVGEGGFALVTGAPGTGKSVTLRILAERLGAQRDVRIGIVTRPQAGLADFYREMGDLFGVELAPHNRWAGAKVLRPVQDQFYGDRSGTFEDPFGHVWTISTHKEDVSNEEMQRRSEAFMKQQASA